MWLPMMPNDSANGADLEASNFGDLPVAHAWDPERNAGGLYAKTLGLSSVAWDAYLLYQTGVAWQGDLPPKPSFWMHQLPESSGADRELLLHPATLAHKLIGLLGDGVRPAKASQGDLGLQLHGSGLMAVARDGSRYTMEDLREAFEESKIET